MKFLETPDLGIPASRAAWDAFPADDAARLRATWTADVLVVVDGPFLFLLFFSLSFFPLSFSLSSLRSSFFFFFLFFFPFPFLFSFSFPFLFMPR